MRQRQESKVMKDVIIKKELEASQSMMLGYTRDLIDYLLRIEAEAVEKKGGEERLKVLRKARNIIGSVFNDCKYEFSSHNPVEVTKGALVDFLEVIDWVISCINDREFQKETTDLFFGSDFFGFYRDINIGRVLVEELLKGMTGK